MKFEIDPNKLTTEQRAHVAAFIMNWPVNAVRQERIDQLKALATSVRMEQPTEEQRLDSEQKSDLEEARDIGADAADNLDAIFGTPDIAKEMAQLTEDRKNLISDIMRNTVPLDSQGLPWDSRIHASTKTFVADGSWKLRRGVAPAEVETVKAQLKELMAVPQALVTDLHRGASTVPVPPAPVIIPQLAEIAPPISGNVGVPPVPKSHYPIDQQPPIGYVVPQTQVERASEMDIEKEAVEQYAAKTTVTLTDLIGRMSAAIAAGTLTQASIAEICTKHGVSEFHLLSNRPDLLPLIDADMKAMGV